MDYSWVLSEVALCVKRNNLGIVLAMAGCIVCEKICVRFIAGLNC